MPSLRVILPFENIFLIFYERNRKYSNETNIPEFLHHSGIQHFISFSVLFSAPQKIRIPEYNLRYVSQLSLLV